MFQSLIIISLLSLGVANYSFNHYDSLTEIKELRETYSVSYLTPRGTRLSFYYGTPVHYLDSDGNYQPIDASFKQNNSRFVTKANSNNIIVENGYIRVNDDICIDCFEKNCSVLDNCIYCEDCLIESLAAGVLMKKPIYFDDTISQTYSFSFLLLNNLDIKSHDSNLLISNLYKISSPILVGLNSSLAVCPSSFSLSKDGNRVSLHYTFQLDENTNQEFNLLQQLTYTNYSGSSYIQHKYFQMGYSSTYSSSLLVGSSPLLDPYGNTPEYRIAFGLSLPEMPLCNNTLSGSLFFKKQSGALSNVRLRRAHNITYSNINGTSTYSVSNIATISLGSDYASVDITRKLIDVYNENSSSLNIIVSEVGSNATCYIYTNYSSYAPYFAIEFGGYGNTQNYFDAPPNVNCCGYALWLPSGFNFSATFDTQYTLTEHDVNESMMYVFYLYQNYFDIVDVFAIESCYTIIPSTHRRIAFRIKIDASGGYDGDYHFMWQTSSGSWAEKIGKETNSAYGEHLSTNYPSFDSSWGVYNSNTYYYAIWTE